MFVDYVCVFLCCLRGVINKYNIYNIFVNEELNQFWKSSVSGSGCRNFKGFFNIARWDGTSFFPHFGSFSGK